MGEELKAVRILVCALRLTFVQAEKTRSRTRMSRHRHVRAGMYDDDWGDGNDTYAPPYVP